MMGLQNHLATSEWALEVRNLTKLYGPFRAVDGISFNVARGKIVGLLGPNGAGKTTTIQMLVGLTLPNGGEIRYFGQDLQRHREACLQRINFSSSYNNLQGRITVWENLIVFARLYQVRDPQRKIRDLGSYFGIEQQMDQRFLTLSAGQRTRVNLVKALLNDPEVVLMDEPTASLDPDIADRMLSLIESLRASRDLAIVYTSHQMDEVTRICDEVIFLDRGRIVAHDTPAGLTARIATTELCVTFTGDGAMLEAALRQRYPNVSLTSANMIVIHTDNHHIAAAIQAILDLDVQIQDVDIKKPTLEDVFLQIARGSDPPSGVPPAPPSVPASTSASRPTSAASDAVASDAVSPAPSADLDAVASDAVSPAPSVASPSLGGRPRESQSPPEGGPSADDDAGWRR